MCIKGHGTGVEEMPYVTLSKDMKENIKTQLLQGVDKHEIVKRTLCIDLFQVLYLKMVLLL